MHQCGRVTYDVLLCSESNIQPGKHRVRLLICAYFVLKIKSEIGCGDRCGCGTYEVILCPDHKIYTTNRFYDLENIGLDYLFVHTSLLKFGLK